jgi:pyrimidine-specific ribonucleoside hydrolase
MKDSDIFYKVSADIIAIHQGGESIAEKLYLQQTTIMNTFKIFPTEPSLYKEAYAEFIDETIDKFGITEWKAIVLTNEIHGHIGIYSILGAKAGTIACEYFKVGSSKLRITSYAGNHPPLSCFNDGVQISTGATIGQGLITVSDTVVEIPTILCEYKNQEILEQVKDEIQKGVEQYGHSHQYWEYVERLARKYWKVYDRHQIFVIEKL